MTKPPPKLPATIAALAIAALLAPPSTAVAQSPSAAADAPGAAPFDERLFGGLRYRYVGPSRGGRVTAVAGHASHPSTFYMGATGGGVWKTDDYGQSWRNVSDGYFGTGSIGAIRVARSSPEVVYVSTGSDGLRSNVIVGDGVYRSDDAGTTWRHVGLERTGNSGALLIHPTDPEFVYVAAIGNPFAPTPERGVYRSRDGGESWELVLFVSDSTGAADLEAGVIWAGANDGPVHLTRDGGASWTEVTPPGIGPHGRVQSIEVSRHDPAKAYVAILRYQLGDFAPYAFRTEDYGATWAWITTGGNGVPEGHPVRVVREDPVREGLLYLGSEFGIFISFDDGDSWQSFQLNLPVTPVTDIKIVGDDLALSTMGRGFWIIDNVSPLRELNRAVADAQAHLFRVRDAYRLRYRGGYGERQPHRPEYPPVGAQIDYLLASEPDGPVTLEILDSAGALVRSLLQRGGGCAAGA